MRVISGSRKGFRLKAPKGLDTRPTQDRIKESLFNIIGKIHEESVVLDLFSGSGGIGIEFLSRGAKKSYFIDDSQESIKAINENLEKTSFKGQSEVYKNDVFRAVKVLGKNNITFDYIFMDPPYNKELEKKALKLICESQIINEDTLIIVEHGKGLVLEDFLFCLKKVDERNYGDTTVTFYIKNII
ncbi:16S rRNA (guanine(966)-N(2))-methyltransferase RsmD [Anaerosalibacter sp. Marseille-P3206]|uniref:16S rRNA (guanine(966)-N(2))-methyltransferase RsmD n=1 Tax=Anaerosalibacter sp. Marseille-P3206 TaxID=1871005 RepID=UPI000986912D|nr:16S rRNA (guanine(966)-N(2))-methyltransferase RsmD [Anaerosalibacter sp. Marseille-P3206]